MDYDRLLIDPPPSTFTIRWPKEKSVLTPVDGFEIHFSHDKPNWWWRAWQFLLLGWKWKDI